jgi:anti-sigma factor RsiW
MKLFARRTSLVCRRAVERITGYLDDALPADQRRRVERHLATCPHCAEYLAQIRSIITASGHVDPGQLSPDTRRTLIELYRRSKTS